MPSSSSFNILSSPESWLECLPLASPTISAFLPPLYSTLIEHVCSRMTSQRSVFEAKSTHLDSSLPPVCPRHLPHKHPQSLALHGSWASTEENYMWECFLPDFRVLSHLRWLLRGLVNGWFYWVNESHMITLYIKPGTLLKLPPSFFIHEKLTATQCQLSFKLILWIRIIIFDTIPYNNALLYTASARHFTITSTRTHWRLSIHLPIYIHTIFS
jgi:hypothetical protein